MKSEILSNRELRIFKHQIDLPHIGISGQEKLKKSRVLIVGAGGKGTFAMQHLAAAGVGYIGICDNQVVEETAIPRQTLYGIGDLGKQKAIIAKQKLTENTPFSKIEIHNICLSESNILSIVSAYDIIVDATDTFASHQLIDQAALKIRTPVVFGALHQGFIMVSVFHFRDGHTFQQMFPSYPHNQGDTILPAFLPAEVILYSLAGNMLANEVLKIMLDLPGILDGKVLKFDIAAYQSSLETL